jgi:hypothetical protein
MREDERCDAQRKREETEGMRRSRFPTVNDPLLLGSVRLDSGRTVGSR